MGFHGPFSYPTATALACIPEEQPEAGSQWDDSKAKN